jgi:hypothetical protein
MPKRDRGYRERPLKIYPRILRSLCPLIRLRQPAELTSHFARRYRINAEVAVGVANLVTIHAQSCV